MMNKRTHLNIAQKTRKTAGYLLGLMALMFGLTVEASRFFRYEDSEGKLVLSHTIPNERVKFGYEIVDEHGRTIQTVAPQLSEKAYQAKVAREKAQKDCRDQLSRVRRLYQTDVDIDNAEAQALDRIDNRISNARANLNHVQNQKQELEGQAARRDLAGQKISNALLDNIEKARSQEKNLVDEIDMRFAEKLQLRKEFDYDRVVFGLKSCEDGLPQVALENVASSKSS